MNEHELIILMRLIERLVIVIFGGISLILGWHLFKARITAEQNVEVRNEKWLVKLKKVGPGLFFVIFGASILIVGLMRPLKFEAAQAQNEQRGATVTYGQDTHINQEELILSINTLEKILNKSKEKAMDSIDKDLAMQAIASLRTFKIDRMNQMFGDKMGLYPEANRLAFKNPDAVAKIYGDKQDAYYEIEHLMNDTLAGR